MHGNSAFGLRGYGRPSTMRWGTRRTRSTGKPRRPLVQPPAAFGGGLGGTDPVVSLFSWSLGGLVAAGLLGSSLTVVPAGEVGITDMFGQVDKSPLASGLHLKNPLAGVRFFNLKTKLLDATQDVPTSEGLVVHLDASILHHTDPIKVRDLYLTVGEHYEQVLIQPEFQSALRNLTSEVSAKALYSSGRTTLSDKLLSELNKNLNPRGIIVEQVMLRSILLPRQVTAAIEQKLSAEQESQRMEFVLLKEQQEAERKRIEATGIQEFQSIVSKGISRPLLEWKGIEATEKLAMSNNAKVVVIGGRDGLPIIFNSDTKAQ